MLEIYQEIINLLSKGEPAVLATVISKSGSAPRSAGAKMLIRQDGTFLGTIGGGNAEHQIREKAAGVMKSGQATVMHFDLSGTGYEASSICGGQMDVLVEPIVPSETLYLFGAGHISEHVAAIGKRLAFRVIVIDPRAEFNNAERFPTADSLIVEEYADAFPQLAINEKGYIVIFTHGHVSDEHCLEFAVGTGAKYIGMIGSQKKVGDIKNRLSKKGISPPQLDGINAPVGLAIGAETPGEIAISILAEIIKVRRSGTS